MFKDRLILISSWSAIILNIVLWIALFGKFRLGGAAVPLHFNVVYGVDLVAASTRAYQLPAAGLVVFLINLWLARLFWKRNPLLSYFLTFASAAVQGLLWATAILLLSLDT